MYSAPALVMLIEDNPDHAELIIRTLEDHRLPNRIRHFNNGQAALDYLFHRGEYSDPQKCPRPDVILLDLRLPGVDGLDVLRTIKETDALFSIPVVILTTSETNKDIHRAYLNYANSYLVKPVGFDEFIKLIEDLGFYWFGWNVQPNS